MDDRYCWGCMGPRNGFEKCSCGFEEEYYKVEKYHLKPGSVINNKYYIGRVIGEGGFGITYIGRDKLHRKVAIKEFFMQGYTSRDNTASDIVSPYSDDKKDIFCKYKNTFLNEGRTMAHYENIEGIVRIYDCEEANNTVYLVMEYVEGETLQQYCKNNGNLQVDFAIDIFISLMNSLEPLHNDRIVHRDISPQNIMISKGKPILLDFGNAREYEFDGDRTRTVILKQGYAPDEQYLPRGKVGPWSDIYSLCATIYYGMTRLVPGEDINHNKSKEIIPISVLISNIPGWFEAILNKGLKTDYKERFQTVSEIREIINERKKSQCSDATIDAETKKKQSKIGDTSTTVVLDNMEEHGSKTLVLMDDESGNNNKKEKEKSEPEEVNSKILVVVIGLLAGVLIGAVFFLLILVNLSIKTRHDGTEKLEVKDELEIDNEEKEADEDSYKEAVALNDNDDPENKTDIIENKNDNSSIMMIETTDSVKLREGPDSDTQHIDTIGKGLELECIDMEEGYNGYCWYKVKYRGKVGYIREDFMRIK